MEAFNSVPPPMGSAAPGEMGLPPGVVDSIDQSLFDESLMENVNSAFPGLPFTPSYDFHDFSTGFEDPFSYSSVRHYETKPPPDDPLLNHVDSPSQEQLDNKLLGFSAPVAKAMLIDDAGRQVDLPSSMAAELRGMFFVAEDVFGNDNNAITPRPLELTCYRRNLWQCLGEVVLPRRISHMIDDQGNQMPVGEMAASIGGVESIEGKPAEIISIPWKSAGSGQGGAGGNTEDPNKAPASATTPANIALDPSTAPHDVDEVGNHHNTATLNMSWKRLQFKHATANNGRRKGLQQHYVVQIALLGRSHPGADWVKIAEIQSSPVIVRGRSPRNFDSKKDIPLTADNKRLEKRSNSDASTTQPGVGGNPNVTPKMASIDGAFQTPSNWATPTPQQYREPGVGNGCQPPPAKRVAMSPSVGSTPRPPIPSWSSSGEVPKAASTAGKQQQSAPSTGAAGGQRPSASSGPINLSLSEDERSPNRSSAELQSPRFSSSKAAAAAGPPSSQSPKEDEEMLYEYFPLSVDDWMPPVDAVYRPHVVHHTVMPAEVKQQQIKNKMKKYFTAEA